MCIAVDDVGNVVTSSDPADGPAAMWTVANVDTGPDGTNVINAVACPTANLCVAVDDVGNGLTSTNPGDGASATWTAATIATNPDTSNSLAAVSCPSEALCVAVDGAGDVLSTTDPADGAAAAWSEVGADNFNPLNAISCPSASLCVAVDSVGNVVSSTDPADGSGAAWRLVDVDNNSQLTSVSCPSVSLCVAGDQPGNALAGLGHTLSVALAGTGTGKVTSSDLSISCPSACSSPQAAGATVTLTAIADDGSTFTGWSGGGCTGTATCAVTIDADQTVTAAFHRDQAPPGGGQTPPGGGQTPPGGGQAPPGGGHAGSGSPPPPPPPPTAGQNGSATPPPNTGPGPLLTAPKPSCRLRADGDRISARVRIGRTRHGARRTIQPKRTLRLTVRCDQAARLSLSATVTSVVRVPGAGHGRKRTRSRAFLSAR